MKFSKDTLRENIPSTLTAKSKIQTVMNTTRDKLNKGKFDPDSFEIVPLVIKDKRIPIEFDNYTIIHITDIHLGQWINKTKLEGIVKIINKLHPDLIVITGDYLSYQTRDYIKQLEDTLKKLKPKDHTISVLGNHDYITNPIKIKKALKNAGIINLENDVYAIERKNKKLQIAGVGSITVNKDNINKVKGKLDNNSPSIMLAHEPDFADTTSNINSMILQLSGHSHGGQVALPLIKTPVRGPNFIKYPIGKYKVKNMIQYTNRGVGTNNFWIRINCNPEITKITLKKG